jgi:hypothetical protein
MKPRDFLLFLTEYQKNLSVRNLGIALLGGMGHLRLRIPCFLISALNRGVQPSFFPEFFIMQPFPLTRKIPLTRFVGSAGASPDGSWSWSLNWLRCWVGMSLLGLVFLLSEAQAAAVRISWNRNTEIDLAGYEVRYGTVRGRYTAQVDAGSKTNLRIGGLDDDTSYYFVVVAYNRSGLRSRPSAEIAYRTPPRRSNMPAALVVLDRPPT